ncbi:hypothetical protein O6H91_17G057700 [Diphasiastrum complanatum]|uniref:Uncharacterized protein n=1 Tax=Diphasiastrum complanatum TaxID=34168 RepID=A0ACC2B765_DIPCM|nr:hypothetical protein O6H91_17G057700 [Diphasiastrum complanatum]
MEGLRSKRAAAGAWTADEMLWAASMLFVIAIVGGATASPTTYTVGGASGWMTPDPITHLPNYTAWALTNTYHVGDSLLFNFLANIHTVIRVNTTDYLACTALAPIGGMVYTNGSVTIPLTTAGNWYFLSNASTDCTDGMEFGVAVSGVAQQKYNFAALGLGSLIVGFFLLI